MEAKKAAALRAPKSRHIHLVAVGPAEVSGTMRDAWIVPQLAPVAFPDGTSGSPSSVSP